MYNIIMQQYFIDYVLEVGTSIKLRDDILYHLTKVLRSTNKSFRLVDTNSNIFLAELSGNCASIIKQINENNELDTDITVIMSLIKQDKFELTLQKLTELGVNRIIPYNAKRSIVKETKTEKKLERYKKILTEASEQSHRNKIPEILPAIDLNDIKKYKSELNIIAYEKDDNIITSYKSKSITIIIGPEGGFDEDELNRIISFGFNSVSLGKRILRAETAAIYLTSLIVGSNS